eukprot:Trichotokara_eunicae@DN153_c0_g1_i1.p1
MRGDGRKSSRATEKKCSKSKRECKSKREEKPKKEVKIKKEEPKVLTKEEQEKLSGIVVSTKENIRYCGFCKKRLKGVVTLCKCKNIYCQSHRGSDEHGCTFDYKAEQQAKLKKEHMKLDVQKFRKV